MDHYNAIIAAIDAGFKKLEAKQPIDYRPLLLADESARDFRERAGRDGFARDPQRAADANGRRHA